MIYPIKNFIFWENSSNNRRNFVRKEKNLPGSLGIVVGYKIISKDCYAYTYSFDKNAYASLDYEKWTQCARTIPNLKAESLELMMFQVDLLLHDFGYEVDRIFQFPDTNRSLRLGNEV